MSGQYTGSAAVKGDLWSGAVLVALGVFVINEARNWEYMGSEGPGPGFFPLWYGIAMVVLSLFLVATAVRRLLKPKGTGSQGAAATDWAGIGRALGCWAVFAASVALLKVLGFLLALALLTVFIAWVMYGKPLKIALAAAVGNMAGFYLVFPLALSVELPVGMLGF